MTIVVVKLKHWNQSNNLAVFTVPVWIRHVSGMWQCSKWKVQYTVGDDGVIFNEHLFSSCWPSFSCLALHTSDLDLWFNSTPFWCKNHFCSLKTELLCYKYFFVKTGGDNLLKKRLESRCLIQELYLYSEHCQTNMAYMSGLGTVAEPDMKVALCMGNINSELRREPVVDLNWRGSQIFRQATNILI